MQEVAFVVSTVSPIDIVMPNDTFVCEGDEIMLYANVSDRGKNTVIRWTADGGDEVLGTQPQLRVTPEQTATYSVVASNGVCDSTVGTVTVEVKSLPVIDTVEAVEPRTVKVIAHGGELPYEYKVEPFEYQQNDIIDLTSYGKHTYHIRDLYGCQAEYVHNLEAPEINIPVVMTPDNDGVHDNFDIVGLAEAYPNSKITIYDRFGKKIAEYLASEGGWDGTYNGHAMPSTDYWYEIYVPEIYKTYTGHFTLLRGK